MKAGTALFLIAAILIFLTPAVFSGPALAGGEDAEMGEPLLVATPSTQGIGGPITIAVEIPFYGGCCYPLYAYEVTAGLKTPKNIEIVRGPEPVKYAAIEAKAGGEPTVVHIKWVIKSMIPGEYAVSVTVNTANCGSGTATTLITVTEGCVMSVPKVYPSNPPTDKKIALSIEVMSPIEGVTIENVTVYYITVDSELHAPRARNDTIQSKNGDSKKGLGLSMSRSKNGSQFWEATIPAQSSACYLYYWIVATDNGGNKTTSPVYMLKIEDLEFAYLVLNIAIWVPLIIMLIGIVVMILIVRRLQKSNKMAPKGLLVLGSPRMIGAVMTKEDAQWQRKLKLRVYVAFGILIFLGFILLVWALKNNQLAELLTKIGGTR